MKDLTIKQLQQVLEEYSDKYILNQHPAERASLWMERRQLEEELAYKLSAQPIKSRWSAVPVTQPSI